MTSALGTVLATKKTVNKSVGSFMLSADTLEHGQSLGYEDFSFYFGGRGGVLGDVDSDVVAAAFGFFPAAVLRATWAKAREVASPAETAQRYAGALHEWGRAGLREVEGMARLAQLAEHVAAAADPAGLPLFAGWRALPAPEDPPARAAHAIQVLREHRGGVHLVALLAAGLTPLEGVLTGGGERVARFFGWRAPYPDVSGLEGRREHVEAATDALDARPYEALDEGERGELVALLAAVKQALTGR